MRLYLKIIRRFRLWRICRRLGIKPFPWQKSFALLQTDRLDAPKGRGTEKTMAVMLRLLVLTPERPSEHEVQFTLYSDHDYYPYSDKRARWYVNEYINMCIKCRVSPDLYVFMVPPRLG